MRYAMRNRMELLAVAALAGAAIGLGGCSKEMNLGLDDRGASVQASDFADSAAASSSAPAKHVESGHSEAAHGAMALPVRPVKPGTPAPAQRPDVMAIGSESPESVHAGGGMAASSAMPVTSTPKLVTSVGEPLRDASPVPGAGDGVTIDAVVGQINGRPVFVSEILEPLDGALRAAARDAKDGNAWARGAAEPIVKELRRRIEDELILSEARSGLSPDQRAGILRFLKTIEANLVSSQRGSEVAADEELREQTGRSLSQEATDIKDRALIRNELMSKVQTRVVVSWRDVQNEYERKHDDFNPPPEYHFRMVYTDATNSSGIMSIQDGLGAGKPFEEIAKLPANDYNQTEGGLLKKKCESAQRQCDFSRWPELNTALRSLNVGQMLGPIMFSPDPKKTEVMRIAWVYLERIDQPEGVSLYDAQLDIQQDLKLERTSAEIGRYFERLRKRGNVSKIEVMADKLMNIATERYAPRFSK